MLGTDRFIRANPNKHLRPVENEANLTISGN